MAATNGKPELLAQKAAIAFLRELNYDIAGKTLRSMARRGVIKIVRPAPSCRIRYPVSELRRIAREKYEGEE